MRFFFYLSVSLSFSAAALKKICYLNFYPKPYPSYELIIKLLVGTKKKQKRKEKLFKI